MKEKVKRGIYATDDGLAYMYQRGIGLLAEEQKRKRCISVFRKSGCQNEGKEKEVEIE